MRRRPAWIAVAVASCALAAAPAGAGAKPASDGAIARVLGVAQAKTDEIGHLGLLLSGEDLGLAEKVCRDAYFSRQDPEAAEAKAFLDKTLAFINTTIANDFEPGFKGPHSDYGRLIKKIDKLADRSSGVQRHKLTQSSLYLEVAAHHRADQVRQIGIVVAAMSGLDCEPHAREIAAIRANEQATESERLAVTALDQATREKPSQLHPNRPLDFQIEIELTVDQSQTLSLGNGGTCPDPGQETGHLEQRASFGPVTVLKDGRFKEVTTTGVASPMTGSWSGSGQYHLEADCSVDPTSFSCGGGFEPEGLTDAFVSLEPSGTLATLRVGLPSAIEAGMSSCPSSTDVNAEVPMPFAMRALAQHAESFVAPLDGLALRRAPGPTTIEEGVVHLGDPLPPIDCVQDSSFYVSCSNAGSHLHVKVTVNPLDED